jgi:hypothetical protein
MKPFQSRNVLDKLKKFAVKSQVMKAKNVSERRYFWPFFVGSGGDSSAESW